MEAPVDVLPATIVPLGVAEIVAPLGLVCLQKPARHGLLRRLHQLDRVDVTIGQRPEEAALHDVVRTRREAYPAVGRDRDDLRHLDAVLLVVVDVAGFRHPLLLSVTASRMCARLRGRCPAACWWCRSERSTLW